MLPDRNNAGAGKHRRGEILCKGRGKHQKKAGEEDFKKYITRKLADKK